MAHIGCDGRNAPEPKGIAPMPYYVFAGTTGTRVAVTDDKSGKKIPPHPLETWVLQRELNLNRRDDRRRDTTQRHNVQTINEKVRHFEFVVQAPPTSRNSLPQAREERFQDRSPDVGGIAAFGKHMTFGPERRQQVIFDIPAGEAEFLGHALR
jgi:hypothetical protein